MDFFKNKMKDVLMHSKNNVNLEGRILDGWILPLLWCIFPQLGPEKWKWNEKLHQITYYLFRKNMIHLKKNLECTKKNLI